MSAPVLPPSSSSPQRVVAVPALIDCHVHFRQPGLEFKADMLSESKAAHAGGISCVCDMPNTKPPTQTIEAFMDKVALYEAGGAAELCDMRFFFGATQPEHLVELERLWTAPELQAYKQRCSGLKLYLDNSTGDMKSSDEVTRDAFRLCGRLDIPLVAHCEHAPTNGAAAAAHPYTDVSTHSLRRPAESEVRSIADAITLAVEFGTPLHVAHLSTGGGLEAVRAARRAHPPLRLTCEVTPHHLFLSTADYGCCGAKVKVNPPVRVPSDREALWYGVLDGTVDCIGTDHAPHLLSEKMDGSNPPSGIPSIELVVPLLLTVCAGAWPHPGQGTVSEGHGEAVVAVPEALRRGGALTVDDVVRLMHTNPNRIFRLGLSSAPVTSLALEETWTVTQSDLVTKCQWSPYLGWQLTGRVSRP